jgi:tyrosinase
MKKQDQGKHHVVSLEDPHNAMHLAVGGFYQYAAYNADEIRGANGDMGDNETAGFDPIFFLHHCFVDYVFWLWQKKHNRVSPGSLDIDVADPGAKSSEGSVGTAPGTPLSPNSLLAPFKDPNWDPNKEPENPWDPWQTLYKVTDIENQLGYTYGVGSLDQYIGTAPSGFTELQPEDIVAVKATHPIDRSKYAGSFVIRTFALTPTKRVEIGREAVLSRWNLRECKNCMSRLTATAITPISKELKQALLLDEEEGTEVAYEARAQYRIFEGEEKVPRFHLGDSIEIIDL